MQGLQVFFASLLMILVVVSIHHEVLVLVSTVVLPRFASPRRWHTSVTVFILIFAHIVEIFVCAVAIYICAEVLQLGHLVGNSVTNFHAYLYFSFASYTSLGIGDISPVGHIRMLTGIEALLGLLMIGWTASFLLLEMRAFWSGSKPQ